MNRKTMGTTRPGFINPKGQMVLFATGRAGTDHHAKVYALRCTRPACGHEYGANGTDVWQRKCPACQNGAPGLSIR